MRNHWHEGSYINVYRGSCCRLGCSHALALVSRGSLSRSHRTMYSPLPGLFSWSGEGLKVCIGLGSTHGRISTSHDTASFQAAVAGYTAYLGPVLLDETSETHIRGADHPNIRTHVAVFPPRPSPLLRSVSHTPLAPHSFLFLSFSSIVFCPFCFGLILILRP